MDRHRNGEYIKRAECRGLSAVPPCRSCPKIPKEIRDNKRLKPSPSDAVDLSDRNTEAFQFHKECMAVGGYDVDERSDSIIRRNAEIIEAELKLQAAVSNNKQIEQMSALMTASTLTGS